MTARPNNQRFASDPAAGLPNAQAEHSAHERTVPETPMKMPLKGRFLGWIIDRVVAILLRIFPKVPE